MKFLPSAFAQESLGNIGGEGLGPFGKISESLSGSGAQGLQKVTDAVSAIIGVMTLGASIWFIFQFLIGGLKWITSSGDKGKLQEARDRITNAFIGLVVVVAGWAILALTGRFFDFDILMNNPEQIIQSLGL
jgi:hypothetical protein